MDNFVDRLPANRVNPFPTRRFLTLTKKVAAKKRHKNKALKNIARAIDSRATFLTNAPFLCISRKIGRHGSLVSSFFLKILSPEKRGLSGQ